MAFLTNTLMFLFWIIVITVYSTPRIQKKVEDIVFFVDEENEYRLDIDWIETDDNTPINVDFELSTLPPGLKTELYDFVISSIGEHVEIARKVVFNKKKTFAVVASFSNMYIFDTSDMSQNYRPLLKQQPTSGSGNIIISERDDLTFVYSDGKFWNVTDPRNPTVISVFTPSHSKIRKIIDKYIMYTGWGAKIRIWNITDLTLPVMLSEIDRENEYGGLDVSDEGDEKFLYSSLSTSPYTLVIANVTNPNDMQQLCSIPSVKSISLSKKVNSDLLFVSSMENGVIVVYNVSNKTNPELIKTFVDPDMIPFYHIKVIAEFMYCFATNFGVKVYDISNVTNPTEVLRFRIFNGNTIGVGGNTITLTREAANLDILFLTFGPRKLYGVPTKVGDYPVQINVKDGSGSFSTKFTVYVRKRIECADEACTVYNCNGTLSNSSSVCSGHGECLNMDIFENGFECRCQEGYSSSYENNRNCEVFRCAGILRSDTSNVCRGRGTCIANNLCSCDEEEGYFGDNCEEFKCFDVESTVSETVCNGNGRCKSPDVCDCDSLFAGDQCEINLGYTAIMAPILTVSGVLFFFVVAVAVLAIVCCVCVTFLLLCVCLVLLCSGSLYLFGRVGYQRFKLRKFSKIRDVDLVIHEQEMEADTSIAHLRINQALFKIEYNEITVRSILGEGGSSSVVFLASWRGRKVAFKSFKTRMLCSNQDTFDEFEREVSVLGSVSHPSIISFFGACLDPARVGILMEYCENGDLDRFLRKYRERNIKDDDEGDEGEMYPIKEKIRMVQEITSALDYLHSRSIIHRDLKLENVLVDGHENTKLMDFGLSRIVESMDSIKTKRIGTSFFMAPEIINEGNYDEKCDVFSFAVMIYIIFTELRNPYGEETPTMGIEMRVARDEDYRPDVTHFDCKGYPKVSEFLRKLVVQGWQHNAKNRPSMEGILKLFTEIEKMISEKEEEKGETSTTDDTVKSGSETDENDETNESSDDDEKEEKESGMEMRMEELESKFSKLLENVKNYCVENDDVNMELFSEGVIL